jgi:hypothetical protein
VEKGGASRGSLTQSTEARWRARLIDPSPGVWRRFRQKNLPFDGANRL